MKNSPRLNVWMLICVPVMGSMVACAPQPCADQGAQQREKLVRVKTEVEYPQVWQATLAEKVTDLIAFVENTWQSESIVEGILESGTGVQVMLPELREADMSITLARRRVAEIADLIQHLELSLIAQDRMRDRLRRLDGFLMKKEIYFNELKLHVEENRDVSFISQTQQKKAHIAPYPVGYPSMGSLEMELNGLQQNLFSTQIQVQDQKGLLESYQSLVDSQEVLKWEMKQVIRRKDNALNQSDNSKEQLREEIYSLENQRLKLREELGSFQREAEKSQAGIYLQTANELMQQMEQIKGKKNKQSIGRLALTYYKKAKDCHCLSDSLSQQVATLESSLLQD